MFSSEVRYIILSRINPEKVFKRGANYPVNTIKRIETLGPLPCYCGVGGSMKRPTNPAKTMAAPAARTKPPIHAVRMPPTSSGTRKITSYARLPSPITMLMQ